jgi:hypothetical protein
VAPSHVSTRHGLFIMMVSCNVGSRPKCGKEKVHRSSRPASPLGERLSLLDTRAVIASYGIPLWTMRRRQR